MSIKVSEPSIESASEAFDQVELQQTQEIEEIFKQKEQPTPPTMK